MIYDIVRVPVPKLVTLLNAAALPTLISAMITAVANETISALTGMLDRGRTYEIVNIPDHVLENLGTNI